MSFMLVVKICKFLQKNAAEKIAEKTRKTHTMKSHTQKLCTITHLYIPLPIVECLIFDFKTLTLTVVSNGDS